MEAVNIYLVLELFLDPAETDFERLQHEIRMMRICLWSHDSRKYARQLQVGDALCFLFGVEPNPILFCSLDENRIKVDEFERERQGLRNGEMTNKEFFHGRLSGRRQIIRKNCLFGMTQLPPGGCKCYARYSTP